MAGFGPDQTAGQRKPDDQAAWPAQQPSDGQAGAGGLGDALDREPERVAHDVSAGLITVETARADYGVAVSADGEVDADATAKLRE